MGFDWAAGLGEGFKGIAPAIQLLMMLQQAKQEREAHTREHTEDISAADRRAQADRDLTLSLANQQGQRQRRQDFLAPLQKQGIFPGMTDYTQASQFQGSPDQMQVDFDPILGAAKGAMRSAQGLANEAGRSEERLAGVGRSGAEALQRANLAGPGHVEQFGQGGFAIGQAPFPNRSESTSTSTNYSGIVPDQMHLKEIDIYMDALSNFVGRRIGAYRAANPYGGNPEDEQRVLEQARSDFESMWPSVRKQIFGNNEPISGGTSGRGSSTTTHTSGNPAPVKPAGPDNGQQQDLTPDAAFDRALGHLRQSYGRTVRQY